MTSSEVVTKATAVSPTWAMLGMMQVLDLLLPKVGLSRMQKVV